MTDIDTIANLGRPVEKVREYEYGDVVEVTVRREGQ